ncbi:MAG: GNAT family N-acetyltransferase, partial [Anaeroplasmataceae bacterium]|nr:GNAT family N-acetyltransferase [Anaeroplasmataceae bacterium]
GYMLYFYNYSTFTGNANLYLEDLFILKEYRKMGIGKTLFHILAKKAVKENCKRIDWVCLHWNQPSLDFYKSIGAKRLDEWVVHRLEEKEIKKLAAIA